MSKVFVLEGARGTGKTTQARNVRQKISEITLVNPTGFHADGEEGYDKITSYYHSWLNFIFDMEHDDVTFVFDRFFPTERVFSELYKSYSFEGFYDLAMKHITTYSDTTVLFFTINNKEELAERLTRDKVPFSNVAESVEETLKQQDLYRKVLTDSKKKHKLNVIEIDTTGKTPEQIEEEVFKIIGGN